MGAPTAVPAGATRGRSLLSRITEAYGQELVVLGALLLLMLVSFLVNPRYLSENNLNSIFSGSAYVAVGALGMSLVIITGNIDVSVGALIGVLGSIAGTMAVNGYPIWLCWLVPLVVGAAIDAVLGVLVAYARIPAIVVSLGLLSILKGGLISVTQGAWITNMPPGFFLAQQRFLGIPAPFWIALVLTIAVAWWMRNTALGRSIYAVGGNADAARAAGVPIKPTLVLVFALHGMFAGIAAVLFSTQLQVIQSTVPPNLEMNMITASVIGGVSILGGTGTVIGSSLAAVLFAAIASSLVFLNVSAYWLRAVLGLLILVTVLADMARRRRVA